MRLPKFNREQVPGNPSSRRWRPATEEELILRLVVITGDEEFYGRLRQVAEDCGWRIERAESTTEAEAVIAREPGLAPLVVFESDLQEDNWRFALRRLHELPAHPRVLLASTVADENLLREVIRNNGYDILPKSAPAEKLIRSLNFAWFWALALERGGR